MTDRQEVLPQRISARIKDVGGVPVSRALPVKERRQIGAGVFWIMPVRRFSKG